MCGRFNLVGPGNLHFRFATQNELPGLPPRYNIAPSQQVVIVTNQREMQLVRWGLLPPLGQGGQVRRENHQRSSGVGGNQTKPPGSVPLPPLPGSRYRVL